MVCWLLICKHAYFTASDIMYEVRWQLAHASMELVGGIWAEKMKQAALTSSELTTSNPKHNCSYN